VDQRESQQPAHRQADFTYANVADGGVGFAFNPLACTPATRSITAAGVLDVFRKLWPVTHAADPQHLTIFPMLSHFFTLDSKSLFICLL